VSSRSRLAVTLFFAVNGTAISSFIARVPDVQAGLGIGKATLGLVLGCLSAGVVGGLVVAGSAVGRAGSRRVALVGASVGVSSLSVVGLAPGPLPLAIGLMLAGAGLSSMDVGMNAQAVGVERAYGRSIMVGFHGAWSVGALFGASSGALATYLRTPVPVHLAVVAVLLGVLVLAAAPGLRVSDRTDPALARTGPRFAWPRGALFPLALVAFAAALGEGTAGEWSGIHLRETVSVDPSRSGWGYVIYTGSTLVVRLVGDRLVRRLGAARVIIGGGWAAAAGFWLVAGVASLPAALVGFALVGGGLAVTVPLAFSAAGRVSETPGRGVAAVASVGYLAFLVGPPTIGFVSERAGLSVAFAGVGALVFLLTTRRQPALATDTNAAGRTSGATEETAGRR
jgi:MFS family permease